MSDRTTIPPTQARNQKRRFARLELKNKVKFCLIFPSNGNLKADPKKTKSGTILNISQGGMLLLTSSPLEPGDFLALTIEIYSQWTLSHVLGKVKRVDQDKGKYLTGIEFCQLEEIYPLLSIRNSSALPKDLDSFKNKFEELLLRRKLTALV